MFSVTNKFFGVLIVYIVPVLFALIKNPFSEEKPMIFPSAFMFNAQAPGFYVLVNFFMVYTCAVNMFLWNAEDLFIFITLSFTNGRYKLMEEDLKYLHSQTEKPKEFRTLLCKILMKHQILLEWVNFQLEICEVQIFFSDSKPEPRTCLLSTCLSIWLLQHCSFVTCLFSYSWYFYNFYKKVVTEPSNIFDRMGLIQVLQNSSAGCSARPRRLLCCVTVDKMLRMW